MGAEGGTPQDLKDWMAYLKIQDCTCRLEWKSLGRLDRINMGKGWVRMTTEPECPDHGTKAQAAWEKAHRRKP